ncbi:MAG: glycosyltransferase family A protein [Candidatus Aenigmatarchaeota archaeon]
MKNPTVSIICTCKPGTDISKLRESLGKQTFRDFEFIVTHDKTVAQGLNSGIKKARGKYLVFTESDCIWNSPYLLEILIKSFENKTVVTLQGESLELVGIPKKILHTI